MDRRMLVVLILLVTFFLGFGIIIPVMPEMILDAGEARFHLYVMLAAYSAASFLASPLWGAVSDRIGRRPVLMAGTVGFAASFFLFGLSGGHLAPMYASRLLGGVFSGAAVSCAVAYVADITNEERRTRAMVLVGMAIGIGFIFGPGIGGLLSRFGNETPFFAAAALSLANFFFVLRYLPESAPALRRAASGAPAGAAPLFPRLSLFRGPIALLLMLMFLLTFTLAGLESTLQYYQIERFRATPQDVGIMFFVSGIAGALVQGGVIRRHAKPGTEPAFIGAGLALQAAGFILLLFSHNVWTASLYLSVFAVGNALLRPCVQSLITQTTRAGQGVTNGLSSSMDSLGRILGPLFAGGLFEVWSALPFAAGAAVSLAGFALLARLLALRKSAA